MADPVWGMLAKAQDDPQTVAEAIAAAITAHESDPTAHMGAGESIDVHRTNTTLDHPALSVLADKTTASETVLDIPFQSLDGIENGGNISVSIGQGVVIDVTDGGYADNYFYLSVPGRIGVPNKSTTDWLVQAAMYCDSVANTPFRFSTGFFSGPTYRYAAFEWDGTHFKAKLSYSGVTYTSGNLSFDMQNLHVYRIQYSSVDKTMRWFVDGVQVASKDLTAYSGDMAAQVAFEYATGSDGEVTFFVPHALLATSAHS